MGVSGVKGKIPLSIDPSGFVGGKKREIVPLPEAGGTEDPFTAGVWGRAKRRFR